ncbi:hypothetical protein V8G54_030727 [Vigna mungo]|uniref:Uncharacterized protein n=1 Tax=Vigna mungo TaxID=3915 RepID=A0AAQ3RLJ9_VIGMU
MRRPTCSFNSVKLVAFFTSSALGRKARKPSILVSRPPVFHSVILTSIGSLSCFICLSRCQAIRRKSLLVESNGRPLNVLPKTSANKMVPISRTGLPATATPLIASSFFTIPIFP